MQCQLQTLTHCKTVGAVEKTLNRLPKGLRETYERILNNIEEEVRDPAYCILQLVAVSFKPLTLFELAEAVKVNCEKRIVDPKSRLRDPRDILEICPSLIELSGYVFKYYE